MKQHIKSRSTIQSMGKLLFALLMCLIGTSCGFTTSSPTYYGARYNSGYGSTFFIPPAPTYSLYNTAYPQPQPSTPTYTNALPPPSGFYGHRGFYGYSFRYGYNALRARFKV